MEWWEQGLRSTVVDAEIRRLETRYCRAFDRRDAEEIRAVYAPDARFVRPGVACEGIEEILDLYRGLWDADTHPTRHFPAVFDIDELAGETFRVRAAYFVVIGHGDDLHVGWGDYEDLLEVRDGGLRIVSKSSTLEGLVPVPDGWARARRVRTPWAIPGRDEE